MSTADEWDLTVPSNDAELVAELRRHGVKPGQRVRLSVTHFTSEVDHDDADRPQRRHLSFAGSISAEPDLAEQTDKYLRGFGQG